MGFVGFFVLFNNINRCCMICFRCFVKPLIYVLVCFIFPSSVYSEESVYQISDQFYQKTTDKYNNTNYLKYYFTLNGIEWGLSSVEDNSIYRQPGVGGFNSGFYTGNYRDAGDVQTTVDYNWEIGDFVNLKYSVGRIYYAINVSKSSFIRVRMNSPPKAVDQEYLEKYLEYLE